MADDIGPVHVPIGVGVEVAGDSLVQAVEAILGHQRRCGAILDLPQPPEGVVDIVVVLPTVDHVADLVVAHRDVGRTVAVGVTLEPLVGLAEKARPVVVAVRLAGVGIVAAVVEVELVQQPVARWGQAPVLDAHRRRQRTAGEGSAVGIGEPVQIVQPVLPVEARPGGPVDGRDVAEVVVGDAAEVLPGILVLLLQFDIHAFDRQTLLPLLFRNHEPAVLRVCDDLAFNRHLNCSNRNWSLGLKRNG